MARLRAAFDGILVRLSAIGAQPGDDQETRLRKALLVLISLAILPIALFWGVLYLALDSVVGYIPLVYAAILAVAVAIFARTRNAEFLLRVNLIDIILAPTLSMIPLGGFIGASAVGIWGILAPMGALVFSGVRSSIRWYAAWVLIFMTCGILGQLFGGPSGLPDWFTTTMLALNVVVGGTFVFALLAFFAQQRLDAQERADNLLLNILPRSIAEKLKDRPQTIADQFSAASILFADVADFTPTVEKLQPAEVVGLLDQLFSRFDTLTEKYELEKIKTIGDCYMAAAGIPTPRPDHARALALLALDMLEVMRTDKAVTDLDLQLRIGINSGPVVAGVIGRKRFLYDLWGDAVNIASRMESHGTPGRIQISGATYDLLRDEFECEPRGPVAVKGKGEMDTWYLLGPKSYSPSGRATNVPIAAATALKSGEL